MDGDPQSWLQSKPPPTTTRPTTRTTAASTTVNVHRRRHLRPLCLVAFETLRPPTPTLYLHCWSLEALFLHIMGKTIEALLHIKNRCYVYDGHIASPLCLQRLTFAIVSYTYVSLRKITVEQITPLSGRQQCELAEIYSTSNKGGGVVARSTIPNTYVGCSTVSIVSFASCTVVASTM